MPMRIDEAGQERLALAVDQPIMMFHSRVRRCHRRS